MPLEPGWRKATRLLWSAAGDIEEARDQISMDRDTENESALSALLLELERITDRIEEKGVKG